MNDAKVALADVKVGSGFERVLEEIRAKRVHHSYLLISNDDLDAKTAARRIHMEAICGCGDCENCRRAMAGSHPDLVEVQVFGTQVLVDQVRQAARSAYLAPVAGPRKTIVIGEAQRMNPNAQNALLKVLEEPAPSTTIVLTASDSEGLLLTVRSRTVLVSLEASDDGHNLPELDSDIREELLTWLASGPFNAGRALDVAASCLATLKSAREDVTSEAPDEFSSLTKREHDDRAKRKGRLVEHEMASAILEEVATFARDVVASASGHADIRNPELRKKIEKLSAVRGIRPRAIRLLEQCVEARRRLEANANVTLVLEWIMLAVCAAFD